MAVNGGERRRRSSRSRKRWKRQMAKSRGTVKGTRNRRPYIERRVSGPEPFGPRRFRCWAATRRRDTRAFGTNHREGHKDPVRHIKCARETRDLTTDTAMSVTVRMSLTNTISELFSTSSRRTYRLKEAENGLRSSVKHRLS